jgi:hypothetical protein
VLSRDVVVERKALPDLFASLGSGRLYNQVRRVQAKGKKATRMKKSRASLPRCSLAADPWAAAARARAWQAVQGARACVA